MPHKERKPLDIAAWRALPAGLTLEQQAKALGMSRIVLSRKLRQAGLRLTLEHDAKLGESRTLLAKKTDAERLAGVAAQLPTEPADSMTCLDCGGLMDAPACGHAECEAWAAEWREAAKRQWPSLKDAGLTVLAP